MDELFRNPIQEGPYRARTEQRLTWLEALPHGRGNMVWRDVWIPQQYFAGDVVRDGDWTMVANKPTTARPSPTDVGDEAYVYTGASPTVQATAKTVTYGTEFTSINPGYLTGYRFYTVSGNEYRIWSVNGNGEIGELLTGFVATTTGWVELPVSALLPAGTTFTLLATVSEPDPTPSTFSGFWDYVTPQNPGVPAAGVAEHANSQLGVVRINVVDDDGTDRSADLATVQPGDIIDSGAVRWSVSSVDLVADYYVFGVAPSQQLASDGRVELTFEVVTPTPITIVRDTDWWLTVPNVTGKYSIDNGDYVDSDDAFGVDVKFQQAELSEDWDLLGLHDSAGGGGGDNLDATYLRLDAANSPVTGELVIEQSLSALSGFSIGQNVGVGDNPSLSVNDDPRITFRNADGIPRTRFRGSDDTTLGHMQDNRLLDFPGVMIGAWRYTFGTVTLLSSGNTIVWSTTLDWTGLWAGAGNVPAILVVTNGFLRQNNQPANAYQGRIVIAGNSGNYTWGHGSAATAGSRDGIPMVHQHVLAAGQQTCLLELSGRSYGVNADVSGDLIVQAYVAPLIQVGV